MATFPSKVNFATGDILTSANMNDIGGAINLLDGAQFAAGKNKIINGDFGVWQRGTSFTPAAGNVYTADRFFASRDGSGATITISQKTFTPGTAPVAGYEGTYFLRFAQTVAGTGGTYNLLVQNIEDVRTFAGQTITISFWAKAAASHIMGVSTTQYFGVGGSSSVYSAAQNNTLTTSWQRFTYTLTLPSISGKTIGTSSALGINFDLTPNTTKTVDIWGVQVEAASTASPFQTATGTKQGELAACQRYYVRLNMSTGAPTFGSALGASTASAYANAVIPVPLRVPPTSLEFSGLQLGDGVNYPAVTTCTLGASSSQSVINVIASPATAVLTQFRPYNLGGTSSAAYLGFNAEL